MKAEADYDCAIVGGGVAGLALSILLAKDGRRVILFEKEKYPFNKVCGEYISNESRKFIGKLGLDLSDYELPEIGSLFLSSVSGVSIKRRLSIGGIGFSRYRLDQILAGRAAEAGVEVRTQTKTQRIQFENDGFQVLFDDRLISAKTVVGAFGKNSNIDTQLKRTTRATGEKLFVAVKYHIETPYDETQVEMHNFDGGYCGMSAIEGGRVNMSYITRAQNLRACGNKIPEMEKTVLSRNPFLKKYFDDAKFLLEKPLVISHLHFGLKSAVDAHILMIGDAAGNIAPLSGNGISMALRSASIAGSLIGSFLDKKISRAEMESIFAREYKKIFSARVAAARLIHYTFGKPFLNDMSFYFLKIFPFLIDLSQKRIHGPEF